MTIVDMACAFCMHEMRHVIVLTTLRAPQVPSKKLSKWASWPAWSTGIDFFSGFF